MPIGVTDVHDDLGAVVRSWADRGAHEDDVARQGWLGLAVPEALGGAGAGLTELAVVAAELGRTLDARAVPAAVAATVIARGGRAPLFTGGGLALGAGVAARADGDGWLLSGVARPVLGGATAGVVVLVARTDDGRDLVVALDSDGARIRPVEALDPTRDLAEVGVDGVRVDREHVLDLTPTLFRALAGTVLAAEATGVLRKLLDLAVDHARSRTQFGRPVGAFQAVKHRLAEVAVLAEQAEAVVWDAATAADEGDDEQFVLAADTAVALATDAATRGARMCLQVFGGIGYTWEHDGHRYYKRALTAYQLLGGGQRAHATVAGHALAGRRRRPVRPPEGTQRIRDEVRAARPGLAGLEGPELRLGLARAGLLEPVWPAPWGRDATAIERMVVEEELRQAGITVPPIGIGRFVVPTLLHHGTPEQRALIEPTIRGELTWCELFSEPEAGSDLGSLRTRATRVADGWVLDGQKVWTTQAHQADRAICLARTDPDEPGSRGLTYFIVDMRAPGVEVRPIVDLRGRREFNEVFLTGVAVPDGSVVGEVGRGWPIARTTLEYERAAMAGGGSFRLSTDGLLDLVRGSDALRADRAVVTRLGELLAVARSGDLIRHRTALREFAGRAPTAASSIAKIVVNENEQKVTEFAVELLGADGATREGTADGWTLALLFSRCLTVAGGTAEIQRNIVAQRLLGLPRDP